MPKRRTYSAGFKREAVEMVRSRDVAASQIARELGINPNMLGRWCREAKVDGSKAFQGQGKAAMGLSRAVFKREPAAAGNVRRGCYSRSGG